MAGALATNGLRLSSVIGSLGAEKTACKRSIPLTEMPGFFRERPLVEASAAIATSE